MKIKQSRKDFINLYQSLGELGSLRGMKFGFTIAKNREALKPLLDKLNKLSVTKDNFKEYEKERVAIAEKHAEKDKDGKAVFVGQQYKIVDKAAFDEELKAVKEKHAEAIKERDDQVKAMTDYFNEEVEMELRPLTLDVIPQDITVDQMETLSVLIID